MKSYLNKALLYKEWKNIMWLSILFLAQIAFFMIMPFVDNVNNLKEAIRLGTYNYNEYYIHYFKDFFINNANAQLIIIGTLILIGTFIIGTDITGRKYEALEAMPFKREEIIATKWILAALTVLLPIILGFLVISSVYSGNKEILSPYMSGHILVNWMLINTLTYLFIVSFIMLIQILSGKNIVGGVIGSIFLVLPMGLVALIDGFMRVLTFNPQILTQEKFIAISDKIEQFGFNSTLAIYNVNETFKFSIIQRAGILAIAIIVIVILLIYAFKKTPLERNGYIVIFKPLEFIFKVGVSVCFGLLGGVIASQFLADYYNLYLYGVDLKDLEASLSTINKTIGLTVLFTLLTGGIVYLITKKVIELSKR